MKLEYFADCSQDCPLIPIYGSDTVGALNLSLAIERVVAGLTNHINIHTIPGYFSVNDCQLLLQISKNDAQGVRMKKDNYFVWELSAEECYDVIGLLEPFLNGNDDNNSQHRHQFLEQNGAITVISSTDRQW